MRCIASQSGILILTLSLITACSTTPKSAGSDTSSNLTESAKLVRSGQASLQGILSALTALNTAESGSLTERYAELVNQVKSVESTAKRIRTVNERMAAQGQAYFANWDAEIAKINNEDIRKRTAERKEEVEKSLSRVDDHYRELSEAYKPFISDVTDLMAALQTDLTLDGVKSMADPIRDTIKEGEKVLKAANTVAQDLEKLGLKLSSILPDATAESKTP